MNDNGRQDPRPGDASAMSQTEAPNTAPHDTIETGATKQGPPKQGSGAQASAMWGGRFDVGPSQVMTAINASVGFDYKLSPFDIAGSRAHSRMLAAVGVLTEAERDDIDAGLVQITGEINAGELQWSADLEDVHMNVEARLAEIIGPVAGKLHTAR